MHVDWNWIKQRPHFIYEELTRHYRVDLFFIRKLNIKRRENIRNSRNTYSSSQIRILHKIPLSGKTKWLRRIERFINRKAICSLDEYDVIWITSPLLLDFIPIDRFKQKKIIYDCMDDFLEFFPKSKQVNRLKKLEINLIQQTDLLFASSNFLKAKLEKIYEEHLQSVPIVINNGIKPKLIEISYSNSITNKSFLDKYNIVYIGTIGEWVDFDLILAVLEKIPNVVFTMIGPVDTKVPSHDRLKFEGIVVHEELPNFAERADAFIVPFKINDLIRAVDPVKVYEYICFQRPILAIKYKEMEKFLPFIKMYSNTEELVDQINLLINNEFEMYTYNEAKDFLKKNTWDMRIKEIIGHINKIE